MNFVQGYVEALLISWGIICAVWGIGIFTIRRFDSPNWSVKKQEYRIWGYVSAINAELLCGMKQTEWNMVFLSVLAGCLIFACITDCKACEVYQFTWWVVGSASLFFLCKRISEEGKWSIIFLLMLLFYSILQEKFFSRFYGRADCHAFVVCAVGLFGLGMNLQDCFVQMLFAFTGLAVVQMFRRNINRKGNLKKAVAFLPYITVSFWIKCGCFCLEKVVY